MDNLIIEKTLSTPYIKFDAAAHRLEIRGESFPENASRFYQPVMEWLRNYLAEPVDQEIVVEFEIVYFNSSTSKVYMTFFRMLDEAVLAGKRIKVNWRCSDKNETAIECGEELKEDLEQLPFQIVIF